ncbi:WD40 repeat-like protein [Cryphonectria parasitica EP155]|uniref:WD40 repeat-like protein n=1 Tax=Cryphonectria parasitica (strain ATCC 38755 / EP155) TaxID=660469 RepID=A0A9P5CML2_CRYP1|nr:WD40 repeat-like protein [Cryphonectria parasitica EP155]KAF3764509.1 WD40 repeat-like protein [Cryphonectria parasitica EP155]
MTATARQDPSFLFHDNNNFLYLLSGEDTHLHIRNAHNTHLYASIRVFTSQPIQGVCVCASSPLRDTTATTTTLTDPDVLVWGGPWAAVVPGAEIARLLSQYEAQGRPQLLELLPPSLSSRPGVGGDRGGRGGAVIHAGDWVYAGALSPRTAGLGALVTAHNEVIPLRIVYPAPGVVALRRGRVRAPPSSRPILYSAQLRWMVEEGQGKKEEEEEEEEEDSVLVAAGTAFGEIVVWRCRVGGDGEKEEDDGVEVLYVLTGHEGSIFGVDISPDIVIAAEEEDDDKRKVKPRQRPARLLASCSDDRTVRVWDISDTTASASSGDGGTVMVGAATRSAAIEARETGFGENEGSSDLEACSRHVSSMPLAVAMGHVSRIWNVRFAPMLGPARGGRCSTSRRRRRRMAVYSFGEDATAQRWRLDVGGGDGADDGLDVEITHEALIHRHGGKHIWSTKVLVATGGSDGKINIVEDSLYGGESDGRSVLLDISGSAVARQFPTRDGVPEDENGNAEGASHAVATETKGKRTSVKDEEEPFMMYALLSDSSIIATTPAGRIFHGVWKDEGQEVQWTGVPMPIQIQDDLRRYQIVRSVGEPDKDTVLLGSASGGLYRYRHGQVQLVCKMARKIADVFPLPSDDDLLVSISEGLGKSHLTPVVVLTMGSLHVSLLVLDLTSDRDDILQGEYTIELEKGFTPTAVGFCHGHLILGSRLGALLLYRPSSSSTTANTTTGSTTFEKIVRIDRPFTKDAVSSIICLPPPPTTPAGTPSSSSPYFLTTSRDGRYRIYEFTTTANPVVHLRHEAVPPLGPNIESALFTTSSSSSPPELVLAGFRSRDFVVWNETRQLELARVDCGGAYRSFAHRINPSDPARLSFVWTKASRTCVFSQAALPRRVVKGGGHGREIKAVAAVAGGGLLATGAEDTTLRIWRYDKDEDDTGETALSCLAVVERHTTGIQCLKWAGEKYLVSSSGNEELFIWRVTQLGRSGYGGLAVVCEGVYPDKTKDGDLRITSFDVEVEALPQATLGDDDDDDDELKEDEEEVLILSLALSNSTLRTYRYSKTGGFRLLARGRYTGACLMQIRHLRITDAAAEVHVLTASTDGHIALWKMSAASTSEGTAAAAAEFALTEVLRLHQSGVKALDAVPISPSLPEDDGVGAQRRQPTSSSSSSFYAVLTGGDDNAIGHLHLEWDPTARHYVVTSRSLANGTHAAAITGLCITGLDNLAAGSGAYRVKLCTASNDQRVKAWRVDVEERGKVRKVALVEDRYSSVADCGDVAMVLGASGGRRGIVVVGVGMEFWSL